MSSRLRLSRLLQLLRRHDPEHRPTAPTGQRPRRAAPDLPLLKLALPSKLCPASYHQWSYTCVLPRIRHIFLCQAVQNPHSDCSTVPEDAFCQHIHHSTYTWSVPRAVTIANTKNRWRITSPSYGRLDPAGLHSAQLYPDVPFNGRCSSRTVARR